MASYLHYERYCQQCKRYFQGRIKTCGKCGNDNLLAVNKWYATFRACEFGDYKQKKVGAFETKKQAEEAIRFYQNNHPSEKAPKKILFKDICNEILAQIRCVNKSSTYLDTKTILESRLSKFSNMEVEKITKNDILLYREWLTKTYSQNTQSKTWAQLGRILNYASVEKNIDQPIKEFKKVKSPQKDKIKKQSWNVDEWAKFIETVKKEFESAKSKVSKNKKWIDDYCAKWHYIYYVFFNYLYLMANRKGEATAVKVGKINFETNTILINESITYKLLPEERKCGQTYKVTDRKNHKELNELIPNSLVELLKDYISTFSLKYDDYLFFGKTPIPPQTIRNRMDEYIKLAKVKRITPHQFRHTHATLIFSSGENKIEDAYVVANRLGHNVKYTLDTYGDIFEGREKDLLNKLNL